MAANGNGRIRHPKKRAFIAAYAKCGIIKAAAEAAGIDRSTCYTWRQKDGQFAAAWEDAREDAADVLESAALRRATLGGSDTLLIFLLKGARPSKYRERFEHVGAGGGAIKIEMTAEDAAVARRIVERRFIPTEN